MSIWESIQVHTKNVQEFVKGISIEDTFNTIYTSLPALTEQIKNLQGYGTNSSIFNPASELSHPVKTSNERAYNNNSLDVTRTNDSTIINIPDIYDNIKWYNNVPPNTHNANDNKHSETHEPLSMNENACMTIDVGNNSGSYDWSHYGDMRKTHFRPGFSNLSINSTGNI